MHITITFTHITCVFPYLHLLHMTFLDPGDFSCDQREFWFVQIETSSLFPSFCGLLKTLMRQCRLVKLLTEFIDPTDQLAGTHFQESIVVMRVCL